MSKNNKKEIINEARIFLEKHKKHFGFDGWNLKIEEYDDNDDNFIASATCNHYDKKIVVKLYKQFFNKETDRNNVLIHELIHGSLGVMRRRIDARVESIIYETEEELVNDITRGFMSFLNKTQNNTKIKTSK